MKSTALFLLFLILSHYVLAVQTRLHLHLALRSAHSGLLSHLDVCPEQLESAKKSSTTFRLVKSAIGEANWNKITDALDPLGKKWKQKIIDVIDMYPQDIHDKAFQHTDYSNIKSTYSSTIHSKDQIDKYMADFEQKQKAQQDSLEAGSKSMDDSMVTGMLDELQSDFGIDLSKLVGKQYQKNMQNMQNGEETKMDMSFISDKTVDDAMFARFRDKIVDQQEKNMEARFVENESLEQAQEQSHMNIMLDETPPMPNMPQPDVICFADLVCKGYQMAVSACMYLRWLMRTIYEILCCIMNIVAYVLVILCVCIPEKAPPYFIGQDTMSCENTQNQPGLICIIPYNIANAIYAGLYGIWQAVMGTTKICKMPIGA